MLAGKSIILGVTGSVAAYKAIDLSSRLTQAGAEVDVVLTQAATKFVAPLSFRSITGRPAVSDIFEPRTEFRAEHIALAQKADAVLIAPATANTIARIATGIADELLSCVVLATNAPVIIAPAMNVHMYENQITQENLSRLRSRGMIIVEPSTGPLACGDVGKGRLADIDFILETLNRVLEKRNDLKGKRILLTAGGTQEPIDAVRCITNYSSGKMGYALAEAARDRGASVLLITAPTYLLPPQGVEIRQVTTALEMRDAVLGAIPQADALIMAAAVADYRPDTVASGKIKKESPTLVLNLVRNPDILSEVKTGIVKVGFAAEGENIIQNATTKLKEKGLDLIVANDITVPDSGFGADTNRVILISQEGNIELPLLPKREVADRIMDRVAELLGIRGG